MLIYPRLLDGFCFPTPQNEAMDACSSFLLLKPHINLNNLKIFQVTRDFFLNNNLENVKYLCKMSQHVALRYEKQERPGHCVSGGSNPEIITPTRLWRLCCTSCPPRNSRVSVPKTGSFIRNERLFTVIIHFIFCCPYRVPIRASYEHGGNLPLKCSPQTLLR